MGTIPAERLEPLASRALDGDQRAEAALRRRASKSQRWHAARIAESRNYTAEKREQVGEVVWALAAHYLGAVVVPLDRREMCRDAIRRGEVSLLTTPCRGRARRRGAGRPARRSGASCRTSGSDPGSDDGPSHRPRAGRLRRWSA